LAGVEGRFDHAAADSATHRLFFAALGNNTLEVVDVKAGKRVHTIGGLQKPTGVLFLAGENLLVVANGDDGTCRFFDGTTSVEKGRVKGVPDADNLRFDDEAKRIYLGYGEGVLGVIDPGTMQLTKRIALAKHPESFQIEQKGARIFVNIPDARQIAVVDRVIAKVIATWPVDEFRANFPMALLELQHRVVVGCRTPPRLIVFDTNTGQRVADAPLSGDIDDLFFDAASSRLFASCGEGFIDVFRFNAPGNVQRIDRLRSAEGARTAFFAKNLGFCLAVPHRGAQEAEVRVFDVVATK
jgi:DNA-binding beta-propeller fold protein YncE